MTFFVGHLLNNWMALPFRNCFTNVFVFCSVGNLDLSTTLLPMLDLAMCFSDNFIFQVTNWVGLWYGLH